MTTDSQARFEKILHNFMFLISVLEGQAIAKSKQAIQIVHIHVCLCLSLRNAVSLFSRVNISDEEVSELKTHCRNFYRGYCLYFNVNPTVWSLGNVVSLHTQEMKTDQVWVGPWFKFNGREGS